MIKFASWGVLVQQFFFLVALSKLVCDFIVGLTAGCAAARRSDSEPASCFCSATAALQALQAMTRVSCSAPAGGAACGGERGETPAPHQFPFQMELRFQFQFSWIVNPGPRLVLLCITTLLEALTAAEIAKQ